MSSAVGWLAAALVYAAVVWLWLRSGGTARPGILRRLVWSIPLGVGAALGPLLVRWESVFAGHEADSLLTLSFWDGLAVVGLALLLSLLALQVAIAVAVMLRRWAGPRALPRALALLTNLLLIPLVFASLLPLVPQVFYQLYRLVRTGLPQQWVLGSPFDWGPFWHSIALVPGSSLSQIGTGLLFWSLFLPSLLMHVCPPAQDR